MQRYCPYIWGHSSRLPAQFRQQQQVSDNAQAAADMLLSWAQYLDCCQLLCCCCTCWLCWACTGCCHWQRMHHHSPNRHCSNAEPATLADQAKNTAIVPAGSCCSAAERCCRSWEAFTVHVLQKLQAIFEPIKSKKLKTKKTWKSKSEIRCCIAVLSQALAAFGSSSACSLNLSVIIVKYALCCFLAQEPLNYKRCLSEHYNLPLWAYNLSQKYDWITISQLLQCCSDSCLTTGISILYIIVSRFWE